MSRKISILLFSLVLVMGSCARMKGSWYLKNERYLEGIQETKKVLAQNPNDPWSNYYLGRFYLALEKPEQALPYLRKAARLQNDNADYYFWLGVAYWAVRDFAKERSSYQMALRADSGHVPARLYLGHNYLDNGQWQAALRQYDKVLLEDRNNPEALYNKGLALAGLQKTDKEIKAWKAYLQHYPEGKWALQAVDHLNSHGDFSYRNYTIGYRRITLQRIAFAPGSTELLPQSQTSLRVVGSILSINKKIQLKIAAYHKGNSSLALARAKAVKEFLLRNYPGILPSRLSTGGYGKAERVAVNKKVFFLDQSVSLLTLKK
ncbi:MAG: tetratricopeptide repeat protein [Deltaproteobacteria bacterium]|nr:tetratricopeptide repeat protein [Deltaproteobacteria bacterium]MBW2072074.1 tetratricopeptide repeat protein [Deltaproteobacteria bacterium]